MELAFRTDINTEGVMAGNAGAIQMASPKRYGRD
jgi:hypothetical protein